MDWKSFKDDVFSERFLVGLTIGFCSGFTLVLLAAVPEKTNERHAVVSEEEPIEIKWLDKVVIKSGFYEGWIGEAVRIDSFDKVVVKVTPAGKHNPMCESYEYRSEYIHEDHTNLQALK